MKIKLHVKTPPGHARSVEHQLRPFLLGRLKNKPTVYVSPDGSAFYWEADVNVKQYFRISRNAVLFHQIAGGTLDAINKRSWIKKLAKITNSTVEGARSLIDDTTVEVIKQASAEEIVEGTTTLWDRIKQTYEKMKN